MVSLVVRVFVVFFYFTSAMKQRSLFEYIKSKDAGLSASRVATSALSHAQAGASTRASNVYVDVDVGCDAASQRSSLSGTKRARASPTRGATEGAAKAATTLLHHASPVHDEAAARSPVCSSVWLASLLTEPAWRSFLQPLMADTWQKGLFLRIERFLDDVAAHGTVVYPPREDIFSAFNSVPFEKLKVVLIGQDPYHGPNQAHGLCFSVRPGTPPPPSLVNMYKELTSDVSGFCAPRHGYLQSWAEQGMLMLNASLTVSMGAANSHSKCGWQNFTDGVIEHISQKHPNRVVFLLWGNFARKKKSLIDCRRHIVIENAHPSPLSATLWWNCKCFSKCNEALSSLGHSPMNWNLPMHV